MSWTKRQLVDGAFAEIAMANWEFDLDPEDIQYALRKMDAMIGSWGVAGFRIGYAMSTNPDDSILDQDSGLAQSAIKCVVDNTACEIAPKFGKTPSSQTVKNARDALDKLLASVSELPKRQFGKDMPRGAGNKPWRGAQHEYFNPVDPLTVGNDAELDF